MCSMGTACYYTRKRPPLRLVGLFSVDKGHVRALAGRRSVQLHRAVAGSGDAAAGELTMTRWFVGVKSDGRREVVAETTGGNPTAQAGGYVELCGPYDTEKEAAKAAKAKPSPSRCKPRRRGQN